MISFEELIERPLVQKAIKQNAHQVNPKDRQDVIQDFYEAIYKAYRKVDDPDKVESYCVGVIIRQRNKYYRNKAYFKKFEGAEMDAEQFENVANSEHVEYEIVALQELYKSIRHRFSASEAAILDAIVLDIKYIMDERGVQTKIANDFGVTRSYVSRIFIKLKSELGKVSE